MRLKNLESFLQEFIVELNSNTNKKGDKDWDEKINQVFQSILYLIQSAGVNADEKQTALIYRLIRRGIYVIEYLLADDYHLSMNLKMEQSLFMILQYILSLEKDAQTRKAIIAVIETKIFYKFLFLLKYYYNTVYKNDFLYYYLARIYYSFPDLYEANRKIIQVPFCNDWEFLT